MFEAGLQGRDHVVSRPLYWASQANQMVQRSYASSDAYDLCVPGKDPYSRQTGSEAESPVSTPHALITYLLSLLDLIPAADSYT